MRLLIRSDASRSGGVGHLVRGLSLAQSARALGHDVALAGSTGEVAWLMDVLAQEGVPILTPPPWSQLGPWAAAEGFDAVHVDSYEAPGDLLDGVGPTGVVLSSIEDGLWGRRPAHVVTDPSFGATPREDALTGPAYLPLRTSVRRGRRLAAERAQRPAGSALEVVVVLGGTDASGALPSLLEALVTASGAADVPLHVVAVGGSGRLPARASDWQVEPVAAGAHVVDLMALADLVVTAAGTTTGEICCLGVPMAALPVVDNQMSGYRELVRGGLAFGLGHSDAPGLSPRATHTLIQVLRHADARARTAALAARAVDGSGAARLVRAIELACGGPSPPAPRLHARPAGTTDSAAQLAWRNDPLVRRASQDPRAVGDEEHARWFDSVLLSTTRHLLVVEDDALQPIASVRWDALDGGRAEWEVSIMLAPHHRGRGWGAAVLAAAEERLLVDEPRASTLVAQVAPGNTASLSLFHGSGYALHEQDPGRTAAFVSLTRRVRPGPS